MPELTRVVCPLETWGPPVRSVKVEACCRQASEDHPGGFVTVPAHVSHVGPDVKPPYTALAVAIVPIAPERVYYAGCCQTHEADFVGYRSLVRYCGDPLLPLPEPSGALYFGLLLLAALRRRPRGHPK